MTDDKSPRTNTKLAASGRPDSAPVHPVSYPPERASTILFSSYEDFTAKNRPVIYGRFGTSTHRAFEDSICELEGAEYAHLAPSGLAGIITSILALSQSGSHILVTDSAYDPVRGICDRFLKKFGIITEYFNPRIGADIEHLIRPETSLILAESPGSITFEIQDIPAITKAASMHSVPVLVDNTWAASYYFKPLDYGASVSILSATKYISGHADCLIGSIATNDKALSVRIERALRQQGSNVSADDAYLAHRGLRTLGARLPQHEANALALARLVKAWPEVGYVLHPALSCHPDHKLWTRDFSGSSGLFGFLFRPCREEQMAAFCNSLRYFGMGYSWGGFESLLIPFSPKDYRTAVPWTTEGEMMRVHAGLEDIDDLVHDLEEAIKAFRSVAV